MDFFDNIIKNIYNFFDKVLFFFKKITDIKYVKKIENFFSKVNSLLIIISSLLIFIVGLYFNSKASTGASSLFLPIAIFGPFVALFLSYLSKKFDNACENLISSNKTTLSNEAMLTFGGVLSVLFTLFFSFASIASIFNGKLVMVLMFAAFAFFSYLFAATQFNPSLLNLEVTKKSSSGEDLIALFSFNLKSSIFFQKIISIIIILIGTLILFGSMFSRYKYSNFYSGISWVGLGFAYPIIAYLSFIIFNFFNSLFLSLLSIKRN